MNPTKPYSYGMELHKMLEDDPTLTIEIIANKFKKKANWIADRLTLAELHHFIGKMVDNGEISLTNALTLAEFSPLQQLHLRHHAIQMNAEEFKERCTQFRQWVVDYDGKGPIQ